MVETIKDDTQMSGMISLIIRSYSTILNILIWVVMIVGFIIGYNIWGNDLWGGIIGLLAAIVINVAVFGTAALVLDIRNNLKKIYKKMEGKD
jgi:hypothetical protein